MTITDNIDTAIAISNRIRSLDWHRLSLPDCLSENIARLNATSENKQQQQNLCSQQSLLFASSYVSGFPWLSKKLKLRRKRSNQQQQQCSKRPTASRRQSASSQHRVFDAICNALWVKQRIISMWKQAQAISYLGTNWRVVHGNREPDLPTV